jgi:hypothetical protein
VAWGAPASAERSAGGGPVALFVAAASTLEGPRGQALRELVAARPDATLLAVRRERALEEVQAFLARTGERNVEGAERVEEVCLVGDDSELPMTRVPDPADKDEAVLTDNFFGRTSSPTEAERYVGDLLPSIPVARIPSSDPSVVAGVLASAAPLHASWDDGAAVSAEVWRGSSHAVHEQIARGASLALVPPVSEDEIRAVLTGAPGRLYFNLHGSDQEPAWYGEGRGGHPPALRPEGVRVRPRGVVVTEACYGAKTSPGSPSIAMAFLERGAGAFVGSTIIAWGPADPPPALADRIAIGFFARLDAGETAPAALLDAKTEILEDALAAGEPLSPAAHNTLLSFVVYSAPRARVAQRSGPGDRGPSAGGAAGSGRTGRSVLADARTRMGTPPAGGSALGRARGRLGARLPPSAWKALSRGRVELSHLASLFRDYAEISSAISRGLGGPPSACTLFRYRAGTHERACITASAAAPWGRRCAMVVTDAGGRVLSTLVSR